MDFNEIMTKKVKDKIQEQVNKDFEELQKCFLDFISKYSMDGTCKDWELIKEYTIKSLSENRKNFIMFPELTDYLFEKEAKNLINKVLSMQYDMRTVIPADSWA